MIAYYTCNVSDTVFLHPWRWPHGWLKHVAVHCVHKLISTYSMLIKIQPDATVCRYLFTAKSLYMFRVSQHPSSGVLKTNRSLWYRSDGTATSLQCGLIARLAHTSPDRAMLEGSSCTICPIPEAAVTVFSTPDEGCCDTRNM